MDIDKYVILTLKGVDVRKKRGKYMMTTFVVFAIISEVVANPKGSGRCLLVLGSDARGDAVSD